MVATSEAAGPVTPAAETEGDSHSATVEFGQPRWTLGGLTEHPAAVSSSFEYVHEPLDDDHAIPLLGNAALIDTIKDRISRSQSGACLIAGFRGVGKTTLVRRAITAIRAELPADTAVVSVSLTVARPTTANELLFAIVRRVFEELDDQGLAARLPADVQEMLRRSYARTTLAVTETTRNATERGVAFTMGGVHPLAGAMPTLSATDKRTRSLATEASFLAYSKSDVEYDVLRIIEVLRDGSRARRPTRRRWWRRRDRPALRIRLVIVLDELDKLTANPDGITAVEALVAELKNVLTTRGAHFVFVAGPDLYDQAIYDSHRGNGVFESVFAWRLYVPCLWDAPEQLLAALLPAGSTLTELAEYLRFKARGMPRRLLQEFNELVRWRGNQAELMVEPPEAGRMAFYAHLERTLREFLGRGSRDTTAQFPLAIDGDRWQLGAYFVTDWILRSSGRQFTVASIRRAAESAELDPMLRIADPLIEQLVDFLAARRIVSQVYVPTPDSTQIGDVAENQLPIYELAPDIRQRLTGFARHSERERGDLDTASPPPPPPSRAFEPAVDGDPASAQPEQPATGMAAVAGGETVLDGRYLLRNLVGQGGYSRVYRARDLGLDRDVAIKVINDHLADDEHIRARFRQEIDLASTLDHPGIVRTYRRYGWDESPFLVMDYIDGVGLDTVIRPTGLPPPRAVSLILDLLDAVDYLHQRGITRIDLKPSNIMVQDGRPIIVDLGTAQVAEHGIPTTAGVVIGSPMYMAPEQVIGQPLDIRTDLYAVGLVLYECLSGRKARSGEPTELLRAAVFRGVEVADLPVSPELRTVISTATARYPADRFQDPAAMRAALAATPEAASVAPDAAAPAAD